ncbi:MAG: hypothetical protein KKG09_04960 [Verrucomicrobia bacterium]|nr:hypothetical protein [Verrucomicrobiota bacterium]MBU4248514.1 hypothetical protein [Verrucomicrobiota bacterium]MBU4292146.1 hypothetical protein [Verrucomicrobiota bacterium]MBU4497335.1 hypothetical protein [Verrucomicrobiota bacterium]MCG2680267.1 hypothetical protein [Kiritimatiellia bacterium]
MLTCPPIIKILLICLGMLALTRLRVRLGLAIILGGVGLNALAGHTPIEVLVGLGAALKQSCL